MKRIVVTCIFLLAGSFLYLTKAQQVLFKDKSNNPVEGLIVVAKELASGKSSVFFSDNHGAVNMDGFKVPVLIYTRHLSYLSLKDTLYDFMKPVSYFLAPNNVSLDEVTVTGSYSTTNRSIYNAEVITKQEIENKAANNLQDLFAHQLNVRINNDPATGSSISLQGISGENIKVLVDGVPVIGRLYNNINLSQLNLNNASRVEVIKGPASVLYGTNALGGVINIITDPEKDKTFKAGINSYYESNGQYNIDAYSNLMLKKTSISISGGRNFFDGWSEVDTSRFKEWKPKEQYFASARISHQFKHSKLSYQTSYFDEQVINKSDILQGWPYKAKVFDEYFNTIRFNNQAQYSHLLNSTHNIQVTGAYSFYRYYKNTYVKNMETLEQILSEDSSRQDTTDFGAGMLRFIYTKDDVNSKFNYQAGFDGNIEYSTGKRIEQNKQDIGDYAFFASVEYKPVSSLTIRPSARVAYNTEYHSPVVPSLQLMYTFNDQLVFRTSYSKGFRSPSLKELYLQFEDANHKVFGNTLLKAEYSNHADFSFDWKLSALKKNVITISPMVFYNYIYNKITLAEQEGIYTYLNLDKYKTKGFQLTTSITRENFKMSSGYSYLEINNEQFDMGSTFTTHTWELNNAVEYNLRKTNSSFAFYWKYNGRLPQYFINDNNEVELFNGEGYSMVDGSVTQRLFKNRIIVGVGVKNILNVKSINNVQTSAAHSAEENKALAGMGRSLFLRLQLQLTKK